MLHSAVLAQGFWLSYLVLAFGIAPTAFRLRFGRWPFAYALRRPDGYLWIDVAFGAATIGFTLCLLLDEGRAGPWPVPGMVLGTLAIALIAWAVLALGPAWRIGQDRAEIGLTRVESGPYRLTRHPIYLGLILLAIALIGMAGTTPCTITFAALTTLYSAAQARSEDRRWAVR